MLRWKSGISEQRMNAELTAMRHNNWDRCERSEASDYAKKAVASAVV